MKYEEVTYNNKRFEYSTYKYKIKKQKNIYMNIGKCEEN